MAIGVYFGVTGLNTETYAECIKRLKKAGAGHPSGRSYHVSFGPSGESARPSETSNCAL